MSFKRDDFSLWVAGKGLKSARTYCSYLRKIERELKTDIDEDCLYDGGAALFKTLNEKLAEYKRAAGKSKRLSKASILKKRKCNAIRQMRNSFGKYMEFSSNAALFSTKEGLYQINWSLKDTMVGTVRDERQLEFIMKYNGYYAPAIYVTEDPAAIRYVALFELGIGSEPGIHRYGEVLSVRKVKRGRIPVPMNRDNGDELYYYFQLRCLKSLPAVIVIRDTRRGAPLFTNKFLLDNCTQSYQLFSVKTAEEYLLMAAINKAFEDMRDAGEANSALYPVSTSCTLKASDGCLSLIDPEGRLLESISAGSYAYRPKDSFERFKKAASSANYQKSRQNV